MSTDTDTAGTDTAGREGLSEPVTFTRPGPRTEREALREAQAIEREDDPPPDVPRDQWDRPLIVNLDGSGVSPYIRASSYGDIIEDEYTLTWWKMRSVAYGLSRGHHLVVKAQSVQSMTGGHNIAALKDVCERALILAGADAGAITGTGLHVLSQRVDAGEDLSWLDPLTLACLEAYRALLAPFEILATEGFVVHDALGGAGSYDRIVRLPFDLIWPDGVIIPAGTILVVDVKTGKVKSMKYWAADFTCQQLIYDEGVPYFPGVTILSDPHKRSAQNVLDVVDQPGDHGRVGWEAIGVPQTPSSDYSLILHIPAEAPWDAHWERVNLDQARKDAAVAQQAWQRHRVKRADRFLALPASALSDHMGPGHPGNPLPTSSTTGEGGVTPNETCPVHGAHAGTITCPGCIEGHRADAAVSQQAAVFATYADDPVTPVPAAVPAGTVDPVMSTVDSAGTINPRLVAILHERIVRCDSTTAIEQLYDAWHGSPSWGPEHDTRCQEMFDRLTVPDDPAECIRCNADRHLCPACGVGVPHGKDCCRSCELRLLLSDAPDHDTIVMLWDAHGDGPEGDGLWREDEHDPVANRRADELNAAAEAAYHAALLHEGPGAAPGSDGVPDDEPEQQPETDAGTYPYTVGPPEYAVTLWCHECAVPPGHPDGDDPLAWCDCRSDETCMDTAVSCRQRAHDPEQCAHAPVDSAAPLDDQAHDEAEAHERIGWEERAEMVRHSATAEAGPFDDTRPLADLRTALREALDTETVDALWEAHKPVEQGGDGLWDDECNGFAQAVYDRLSHEEVRS